MKKRIRAMGLGTAFLIIAALGLMAYIRLAPSDPARWHVDLAAPGFAPGGNWATFCPAAGSHFAPMGDAATVLSRLDAIAMATPHTTRLAGSPGEGRITWVTRSTLMGFPDYSTAQILSTPQGARFCLVARQRFGGGDWGVNAARIAGWMQQVLGLTEPPDPVPF